MKKLSRIRRERRTLLWIIAAAALIAAAIPAWKAVTRESRQKQLLSEASGALAQKDFRKVLNLSGRVLRADPESREILPILLRAHHGLMNPQSGQVAAYFLSRPQGSRSDRLFAWRILCDNSSTWTAAAIWNGLPPTETTDPDFTEAWARRLLGDGLADELDGLLGKFPQPHPPALIRCDLLGRILLKQEFVSSQNRLAARLRFSPEEAGSLLSITDSIPFDELLPSLCDAFAAACQPAADGFSPEDRLRLLRLRMARAPDEAAGLFQVALSRYRSSAPLETARWCDLIGKTDEAVATLLPLVDAGVPGAYNLLSGICFRSGPAPRRVEWSQQLVRTPKGVSQARIECDKSFLASGRGDVAAASAAADSAVAWAAKSRDSYDSIVRLAEYAAGLGMETLSSRLWVEAIVLRKGPLPLSSKLEPLFQSLASAGKEEDLYRVYDSYRDMEPGNPDILARQLYLGCLKGIIPPERVIDELTPVLEGNTGTLVEIRRALALAHLLLKQDFPAAGIIEKGSIEELTLKPSGRVIHALSLKRTGHEDLSSLHLEAFPWDTLLPSERRIFRSLLELD